MKSHSCGLDLISKYPPHLPPPQIPSKPKILPIRNPPKQWLASREGARGWHPSRIFQNPEIKRYFRENCRLHPLCTPPEIFAPPHFHPSRILEEERPWQGSPKPSGAPKEPSTPGSPPFNLGARTVKFCIWLVVASSIQEDTWTNKLFILL